MTLVVVVTVVLSILVAAAALTASYAANIRQSMTVLTVKPSYCNNEIKTGEK